MKTVEIKSALWYKTDISGKFPLCAPYKSDKTSKRDGFIWIEADFSSKGKVKKTRVAINEKDWIIAGMPKGSKDMSDAEISQEIKDRFEVMEMLTQGVIDNSVKGLIISGAAGIGKTHTVEHMLEHALATDKITKYSMMGGSCTAIGLYLQLWQHQNAGNVLVLDDLDAVFDDQEAMNILKRALDTGRRRTITWASMSRALEGEGADTSFEFKGTVIFITNHNFDERIAKGTKLSPHYQALLSRCMYLDLGIHSMREVIVRIRQVIDKTTMMEDMGINKSDTKIMFDWLMENRKALRKVDLRTMIKLAQAFKISRHGWKKIAKAALCTR